MLMLTFYVVVYYKLFQKKFSQARAASVAPWRDPTGPFSQIKVASVAPWRDPTSPFSHLLPLTSYLLPLTSHLCKQLLHLG